LSLLHFEFDIIETGNNFTVLFAGANMSVSAEEVEGRNLLAGFAGHVVHLAAVDGVEEARVLLAPLPGGYEEVALCRGFTLRAGHVPRNANRKNSSLK